MRLDLRHVVRNLIRRPGFSLVTIATLALGIGANAVIFSVVNGVVLRPLPFRDAGRLVRVYHSAPELNVPDDIGLSDTTYFFFRESGVLEDLAVFQEGAANLSGSDTPERVASASISHSLFETLGVPPALGRAFHPEDELPGAARVVILSDGLWRRHFGARPDVIGETVLMDGVATEIVGVMPPDVRFPRPDTELWEPMRLDPENTQLGALGTDSVARMRPELSREQTEAQLVARLANLEEALPDQPASPILARAGFTTHVQDLRENLVGDVQQRLWLLMGSVGFVLLIACANVANLFLVRAEGREREMAIRSALGAGRRHLVTGFLAEGISLALVAGVAGLLLALAGTSALVGFGPERLPRLEEISVDFTVIGFTLAVALVAGLLFSAIPALRYGTAWLAGALREGGRASTAGPSRLVVRNVLVGFQIAIALVLLVGSGLMVRSFRSLARLDPGFLPEGVLTFRLALNPNDYPGEQAPADFVQRSVDELGALPGVSSVGAISNLPLSGSASGQGVSIEDHPLGPDELPPVHFFKFASPGYFETLGIPLVAGRTFVRADHEDRRPSAIVNEAFARRYWPQEEALGKRLQLGGGGEPDPDAWYTIVGVVGNVRNLRLEDELPELMYFPLRAIDLGGPSRWEVRNVEFAVRTGGNPTALVGAVRERIGELDPNLPIANIETMGDKVATAMAQTSFTMTLLSVGAIGALLIGAVGIYGVISYVVSQQTREIGVRLALGARVGDIGWMVLRRSMVVTGCGIVAGVVGAVLLTRFISALLFGVDPLDPLTFAAVILLLAAVASVATWMPARRAARVDPLEALRYE